MKIQNKDFWEKQEVIDTQNTTTSASSFELFMFKNAKLRLKSDRAIQSIKIFGCGTGREIYTIADFYKPSRILASDISENMISLCNKNLETWKLDSITETLVTNATDYKSDSETFDLVTILNSMLTYVPHRTDRLKILKNAFNALKENSVIIGTVHNQKGTPKKTAYFNFRRLFSIFLKEKVGNRSTGMKGYKVSGYYYDKTWLTKDLKASGFKNIEVYSLEEYFKLKGKTYNRKKGYNNLFFICDK